MTKEFGDSHDRATIRALQEIDTDLAGLFIFGRRLSNEPDKPGLGYLIAHAGRELTNCVMRELAPTGALTDPLDAEEELQRVQFGNVLGLSPNHDTVRRWFSVHKAFVSAVHARVPAPKFASLRQAFAELAELMYGLVGGYFETQAEIDELAASEAPVIVPRERLRTLLLRPVQRRRFFSLLDRPEWIGPLREAGFFRYPPSRVTFDDGSWKGREWPEGAYLVRMASGEPSLVVAVLSAIAENNDNPVVWRTIAEAISALPAEHAAALASKLAHAMRLDFAWIFAHSVIDAAKSLAQVHREEVFKIVEALLWPGHPPDLPTHPTSNTSDDESKYLDELREKVRSIAWSDNWLFRRINDFEFEQILHKLVPLLDAIDADRTLDLLLNRLDRVTKLVPRANARFAAAIRQLTERVQNDDEAAWDDFEITGNINSRHWCRSLYHEDAIAGIRQRLAVATYARVRARAAAGVPLKALIQQLESRDNEIIRRMVLGIIAETPRIDNDLQQSLDSFVASQEAISPPFGAVEAASLLRAHFTKASPLAQQAFVAAVEAGPMKMGFGDNGTSEEQREAVEHWQSVRIRWFHECIPEALQPLANRLGIEAAQPTPQQQELDETGSWFGGVRSAAHKSAATAAELLAMQPEEMVQFLCEWQPLNQVGDPFDAPSLEGLCIEVRSIAANTPEALDGIIPFLVDSSLPLEYVTALMRGVHSAIQQNKQVSPSLLLALVDLTWQRAEEAPSGTKREKQDAKWAADSVCEGIREYLKSAAPSAATRAKLWPRLAAFAESAIVWREDPDIESVLPRMYSEARHATQAALSARLTETIIALAWAEFIAEHATTSWPPPGTTSASDLVTPILERILAHSGPVALAAQGACGRQLNQLMWLAREWTTGQLARLLDGGSENPALHPAWALYLGFNQVSSRTFPELRSWYARHAAWLPPDGSPPEQDPDWSLADSFALHISWACIHGVCHPGDAESLVENAFSRLPVDARNRAYWSIWRAFTNATKVPPKMRRNLVTFWESRLTALESATASESRDEEVHGLCQLIGTPHLAVRAVIRLGQRTTALLGSKSRLTGMVWARLANLAEKDPRGTLVIVERFVNASLVSDYPFLMFEEIAPSLRSAIHAGGKTRERALRLLHRIGNAGLTEFEVLWTEAQQ